MSSTATQITRSPRVLPDFSFPPRYASRSTSVDSNAQNELCQQPALRIPKIITAPQNIALSTPVRVAANESPLLRLPVEIRLRIYHYVLSSHPIFHAHLAPPPNLRHPSVALQDKTITELHTAFLRPLGQSLPTTTVLTATAVAPVAQQPISTLHPQSAPTIPCRGGIARGKIPTGLLAACRQVYDEARLLPWEQNTFSFINWFWSGLYASRQFTRGLKPWQIEAIRWVEVEVLSRDLTPGAELKGRDLQYLTKGEALKARTEWEELCHLWDGVHGLRLGVKGSVRPNETGLRDSGGQPFVITPEELSLVSELVTTHDNGILDVNSDWIKRGILAMKSLRWVELEIEDENVNRDEKMQFCQDLESSLNASGRERAHGWSGFVKVVFVEKVREVDEKDVLPNLQFEWFGGVPGDDSVDGM